MPPGTHILPGYFPDTISFGNNITTNTTIGSFIVSYNKNGKLRWLDSIEGSNSNTAIGISTSGDILYCGNTGVGNSKIGNAIINSNMGFLLKIDTAGKVKWMKQYKYARLSAMAILQNGKIYLQGTVDDSNAISLGNYVLNGKY